MNLDAQLERACSRVPGLVRGALVLVPDGFLLAATRGARSLELEPLIRSAARCFGARTPSPVDRPIVEYLFVIHDQLVVIQGGRANGRLALAAECERADNLGFVLGASRLAFADIEASVDLSPWGV